MSRLHDDALHVLLDGDQGRHEHQGRQLRRQRRHATDRRCRLRPRVGGDDPDRHRLADDALLGGRQHLPLVVRWSARPDHQLARRDRLHGAERLRRSLQPERARCHVPLHRDGRHAGPRQGRHLHRRRHDPTHHHQRRLPAGLHDDEGPEPDDLRAGHPLGRDADARVGDVPQRADEGGRRKLGQAHPRFAGHRLRARGRRRRRRPRERRHPSQQLRLPRDRRQRRLLQPGRRRDGEHDHRDGRRTATSCASTRRPARASTSSTTWSKTHCA